MTVPVVDVRKVWMTMGQRCMNMPMAMRFSLWITRGMRVPVMFIVSVRMRV